MSTANAELHLPNGHEKLERAIYAKLGDNVLLYFTISFLAQFIIAEHEKDKRGALVALKTQLGDNFARISELCKKHGVQIDEEK